MEGADAFTPVHIPSSMIHSSLWKPWPMEIDDKHDDLPIKHDDLPIKKPGNLPIKHGGLPHSKWFCFPINKWWFSLISPYFPHENWWFPLQKWWFSGRVTQGTDTAAIPDEPPSDEMLEKLSQVPETSFRGLLPSGNNAYPLAVVVKCPMTWVYWTSPKIVAI